MKNNLREQQRWRGDYFLLYLEQAPATCGSYQEIPPGEVTTGTELDTYSKKICNRLRELGWFFCHYEPPRVVKHLVFPPRKPRPFAFGSG